VSDPPRRDSSPDLFRKKQRLAALMVHDLRNPLTALSGNLELLREELVGQPVSKVAAESLRDCLTLLARIQSLVATILDVDELEDGVLRADRSLVDLGALVQQVIASIDRAIQSRGLRVGWAVPHDLRAMVDPSLFTRVVENLLDNAVRYATRGGTVAIHAEQVDGALLLAIGNDGPPIADGEREAIFGRYHRVEARRAAARAGRGLGLYFCRLAIEAHGGMITVESRADLGAVFVVRVPDLP
jgi:two-component system, OmpR family, heavy metal sensor histidine kinase CusS